MRLFHVKAPAYWFVAVLLIVTTGCGRKAVPVPAPAPPAATVPDPPPPAPPPQAETPAAAPEAVLTEEDVFARKSLDELNAERPLSEVRFDYDSSALDGRARATLDANAGWLRRWASTRVAVEGHADARGTSEYNLALGERRAAAVRDYLVSLGIPAARMTTVSRGEDMPLCADETDTCWARNRRADFTITAK